MLLQRQQKAFGSRLAVEVAMNATLGRRTGIHGVTETGAVRIKDVKVMNDSFHGDLLNQLVSGFIKQTKNNQITNDVVSKQVHRLGQLVHATKLVGGRNIIGNGVVLFHNILQTRINHLDSISREGQCDSCGKTDDQLLVPCNFYNFG